MSVFRKPVATAAILAAIIAGSSLALGPVLTPQAYAQELSASHVAVAVEVVRAAGATRGFDNVLPGLANQVIDRLIRLRPDLHKEIIATVQEAALKLAVRRAELDNDIARIWAKRFTEDELRYLLGFYTSDAGKKFSDVGPLVVGEAMQSVERWTGRVGEELFEKTREELRNQGIDFGN
jgi:hypothetical protein